MWWRELQAISTSVPEFSSPGELLTVDPTADVADGAILDATRGPIIIGAGTKICHGAYLQGPIVIGSDCLIGNLAIVRGPTRIGDGTRIGFATEIKNAIIEERVAIGPQCFVADSKIENDAYLGAQVRTSNHRLDKATVKVMADGEAVDTGLDKLGYVFKSSITGKAIEKATLPQLEQFMAIFPEAVRGLISERVRLEDAPELLRRPGGIKQVVSLTR